MTRVVCDTMVWYELAKGRIVVPDPEQYQLVCTHLSLTEIACSSNNFNKLQEVKAVISEIVKLKPEMIIQYPYEHARFLADNEYTFEYKVEEDLIISFLRIIRNQPGEELAAGELKDYLTDIAARRKENSIDWANFQNELYKLSGIPKSTLKKFQNSEMKLMESRKWLLFQLNQLSEKELDFSTIDWSRFELYENVHARYIRNLELSNFRADRNDDNDLKNMLYVQPGEKYWTLEKRWLSIIREIDLENYLYY
ncbi:MAG: hypothetical protein ACN4EP_12470 [Sediminibacterium sp.]